MVLIGFILIGLGCGKEKKEDTYPHDETIIAELPKMGAESMRDMKSGDSRVIRSQEELLDVFSIEEIQSLAQLQNIDFTTYSVLIGMCSYSNEVNYIKHTYTKTGDSTYTYHIKISGDATRPDSFLYGIIVKMLPADAVILFEIEKI